MSVDDETLMTGSGGGKSWPSSHAMDARYRLPWIGGSVYLRVILGRERRPQQRSNVEISESIRKSLLNILFFALSACLIYTAAITIFLMVSSVLL